MHLKKNSRDEERELQEIIGNFESVTCKLCGNRGESIMTTLSGVLRKCNICNLVYASPRLNKKALKSLYVNYLPSSYWDKKNGKEKLRGHESESNKDLDLIEKYIKPGMIFDVGAAAGTFLNCAKQRGWDVEGTDLSKVSIRVAKDLYNIDIIEGELTEIEIKEDRYHAITLRHCIEHLREPIVELSNLNKMLKKDGVLFISTPEHATNLEILKQHTMLPHHIINYTRETITKLLRITGFKIIKYESIEYADPKNNSMKVMAVKLEHSYPS